MTSHDTRRARRRNARRASPPVLKLRDARFRILTEHSSDVFFSMRFPEGCYEYISPSVEERLGFAPRDFYADPTTILRCVAPAWRETVHGWLEAIAQGRVESEYEFQVLDMAGRTRWLHQRQVLVPTPDGKGMLLQGVATDVTELRATQQALAQSEARFREVVEGSQSLITQVDGTGVFTYVNPIASSVLGIHPVDCIGRSAFDFIHPDDREYSARAFSDWIANRLTQASIENRQVSLSGEVRHFVWHIHLHYDENGTPTFIDGIARDITERKLAEEALRKSELLFRKLLGSMHEGVWAVDANRRTTFVNERLCTMLGYTPAEFMTMVPSDVLEWPQNHLAKKSFQERKTGYPGAADYVLIRKDGTRLPAHVVSSPIMAGQGQFEGLVCSALDLSERARLEHDLRRNQARFEALYELSRLAPATEQELASFTLREAIRLTDSTAGVLFFVSPDGQTLVPKAWETEGFIAGGLMPSFPTSGPLPWASVLQSGRPLLLNDFSEHERLVPPGHPPLTRFMAVPALDGAHPAAVLGLTGKTAPYTSEDTLQTTLLLDGMWHVVRAQRDEEHIRASLQEKDALLHELHHRVKNNMQVVSSLLDLAGRRLASPEARLSLVEVRGKVQAMSLIHAQLHNAGSTEGVSLERFVRALFNQLREVYAGGLELCLWLQLGDLTLPLDQAVPLGLTLNEALANVFKHACPPTHSGGDQASRVEIRATRNESGWVSIEVQDNGPGLPQGLDPTRAKSLGMKLMFSLMRHQLRGELEFVDAAPGVCVRIHLQPHIAA